MAIISTSKELHETLAYEYALYFGSRRDYLKSKLLSERSYKIWRYQKTLRKLEYSKEQLRRSTFALRIIYAIMFAWYCYLVNKRGSRLSIDTWCGVFNRGLVIYHTAGGIVVNSDARIGLNCRLHGNNCIGNNGVPGSGSPVIGDNCELGYGACVIGNITLANNIKIAAGAVVVKSCVEEGVTLAGIPAKIINK